MRGEHFFVYLKIKLVRERRRIESKLAFVIESRSRTASKILVERKWDFISLFISFYLYLSLSFTRWFDRWNLIRQRSERANTMSDSRWSMAISHLEYRSSWHPSPCPQIGLHQHTLCNLVCYLFDFIFFLLHSFPHPSPIVVDSSSSRWSNGGCRLFFQK